VSPHDRADLRFDLRGNGGLGRLLGGLPGHAVPLGLQPGLYRVRLLFLLVPAAPEISPVELLVVRLLIGVLAVIGGSARRGQCERAGD
jgi:hypothetical protein